MLYFPDVSFNLAAWAGREVAFAGSLPFVAVAGDTAAPILGLQHEDPAGTQHDVVDVASAFTQIEVVDKVVVIVQGAG